RRAAFFYPRPFRVLPAHNGGLIPLDRAPFGLLTAPAQGGQHLPDVPRVIANPELLVDQLGHSWQGPEIGRVASSEWPPHQGPAPLLLRPGRQPRRPARRGFRGQAPSSLALIRLPPAKDRTHRSVDLPGHRGQRPPTPQELHGRPSALLQLRGTPRRSH